MLATGPRRHYPVVRAADRLVLGMLAGLLVATAALGAEPVESYPSRPVHIVLPFTPGGATDVIARQLAPGIHQRLGQPVVIENKPGGNARIGANFVAKAEPDGYTLLLTTNGAFVIAPFIGGKPPYDGPPHLAAELLKQAAGFKMLMVPYSGTGDVNVALLRGDVDIALGAISAVAPILQQKDVKALAVTSAKRAATLPNVPSIAETVPGYELLTWFAVAAPAGTPRPIVEKIRAAVLGALGEKNVIEALARDGSEIATSTPDELRQIIEADYAKYGALIKSLNIKD